MRNGIMLTTFHRGFDHEASWNAIQHTWPLDLDATVEYLHRPSTSGGVQTGGGAAVAMLSGATSAHTNATSALYQVPGGQLPASSESGVRPAKKARQACPRRYMHQACLFVRTGGAALSLSTADIANTFLQNVTDRYTGGALCKSVELVAVITTTGPTQDSTQHTKLDVCMTTTRTAGFDAAKKDWPGTVATACACAVSKWESIKVSLIQCSVAELKTVSGID